MKEHCLNIDELDLDEEQTISLEKQILERPHIFAGIAQYFTILESELENEFPGNYYDNMLKDNPGQLLKMLLEWQQRKKIKVEGQRESWSDDPLSRDDFQLLENSHKAFKDNSPSVWAKQGGCTSVPEFVKRMKVLGNTSSDDSLGNMIRKNLIDKKMVGYKPGIGKKSPWSVPLWQIDLQTGGILNGISEICEVFNSNGYAVQEFITTEGLPGLKSTPLELLRQGRVQSVVDTAMMYENL